MISLDVKNLYTSIPKHEALDILKNKLTNSYKLNTKEMHFKNNIIHQYILDYNNKQ